MKKIFMFKFELFALVMNAIATILSYSIYISCECDWRVKVLMYFCATMLLFSILTYKSIKEFRQEVYRRW